MISAGSCYVVEMHFVDDGSVEFELFEDSNDADFFAASQAINFMVNTFECNTISAPKDYKDAYHSILVRFQGGSYDLVLDEFEEFILKVITTVDPDNVISIVRYAKNITPPTTNGSTAVTTTANGWSAVGNTTNLGNIQTIGTKPSPSTPVVVAPLVDVPCRVCKRNVNKSEKTCWHCGCDDPANS